MFDRVLDTHHEGYFYISFGLAPKRSFQFTEIDDKPLLKHEYNI